MDQSAQVHQYDFTVVTKAEVARGIWRMEIAAPELAARLRPGQFVNIAVPGDPSQIVRVPLSFASADAECGTVELVFAAVGDGTRRLAAMEAGEGSTVLGPCGHGWRFPDTGRVLLVAGGVGAPPVVAAGRELAKRDVPFAAVLGAQTADKLWGVPELEELGAKVVVTTDDGSRGVHGFTTQPTSELLATGDYTLVMTCGPGPMMAGIAKAAHEAGVACQASLERMMTCGFGACHTCNVAMAAGGYKFCCTDGPVFDAEEVAW